MGIATPAWEERIQRTNRAIAEDVQAVSPVPDYTGRRSARIGVAIEEVSVGGDYGQQVGVKVEAVDGSLLG